MDIYEKLTITGVYLPVNAAIQLYTLRKAKRLLTHNPEIEHLEIKLGLAERRDNHKAYRVKGSMHINGEVLNAEQDSSPDLYEAIGAVINTIEKQLAERAHQKTVTIA